MKYTLIFHGVIVMKKFRKFRTLFTFLQKIPNWDVGNCMVLKKNKKTYWVGQFYARRDGKLSVRFK